jgi:restriction endonuclease S subunit
MWTGTRNINEIMKAGGWKVEFFCHTQSTKNLAFKTVKIGDVLSERKESIDPQSLEKGEITYIGLENIQSTTGDLLNFSKQSNTNIKSRSKIFYEDDILYGRLRPILNKVFLVDHTFPTGICSNEFIVLTPNKYAGDPTYLRFILASDVVHKLAINYQTGSALPRLGTSKLLNIEIPLPPLETQKFIGEYLKRKDNHRRKILQEAFEIPDEIARNLSIVLESGNLEILKAA